MAKANAVRVFKTEYYDDRLFSWVAMSEGRDLEKAKSLLSAPIIGDPRKRVAEYERTVVRKFKYKLIGVAATA